MRTKGKGRGAPDAEHPWNEIVPGLWMGGHHYTPPSGERTPAIVADEFDVVISMYRRDGHGPPDHVEHHYEALPDRPLTADQLETVSRLADTALAAVRPSCFCGDRFHLQLAGPGASCAVVEALRSHVPSGTGHNEVPRRR